MQYRSCESLSRFFKFFLIFFSAQHAGPDQHLQTACSVSQFTRPLERATSRTILLDKFYDCPESLTHAVAPVRAVNEPLQNRQTSYSSAQSYGLRGSLAARTGVMRKAAKHGHGRGGSDYDQSPQLGFILFIY